MNVACPACQKVLVCFDCSRGKEIEREELVGVLTRNLGNKIGIQNKKYYFGTLSLKDGSERVVFFFDYDEETEQRLLSLGQGERIKVFGYISSKGGFIVKKLLEDGSEIF